MNVDSRPLVVHPTFRDTQQQKLTQKEMDMDDSIHRLLSMYLDVNTTMIIRSPPQNSRMMMLKHSPDFRTRINMNSIPPQQQNWLGEKKKYRVTTCTELERNTKKNSHSIKVENDNKSNNNNKKARSKSVSFNETVTLIHAHKKISFSDLIQPPAVASKHADDLFVDFIPL